jgi:hypothetical protein
MKETIVVLEVADGTEEACNAAILPKATAVVMGNNSNRPRERVPTRFPSSRILKITNRIR